MTDDRKRPRIGDRITFETREGQRAFGIVDGLSPLTATTGDHRCCEVKRVVSIRS